MQVDPVLLLSLICKDPAGQVSALPWLSPGTRHCRKHLLPFALPNPHTGMARCPSLCGQAHCSQSHRECQGSASGEEVAASSQSCPGHGLAANPAPFVPHPNTIPSGHSAKQDQPQQSIFVFDSLICPFCRAIPCKS